MNFHSRRIFLIVFLGIALTLLPGETKPRLAVLDFSTNNVSDDDMLTVLDRLSSEMFKTGMYTVIEIKQRNSVLDEQNFSLSGLADEESQLEAGKLLLAEFIVTGSISKVDNLYYLSAKIISTETTAARGTADGNWPSLSRMLNSLGDFVSELVPSDQVEIPVTPETREKKAIDGRKVLKWTLAGSGGAALITGTVFLIAGNSVYTNAYDAYTNAGIGTTAEQFDALWADVETAVDIRTRNNIIGISLGAAGLISSGIATWLFISDAIEDNDHSPEVQNLFFIPTGDGVTMGGKISW